MQTRNQRSRWVWELAIASSWMACAEPPAGRRTVGDNNSLTGIYLPDAGPGESGLGDTSGGFFIVPSGLDGSDDGDNSGDSFECSVWLQNCADDQKCVPWDNTEGYSWNASHCVPIVESAAQPGESCTVEGPGNTGFDTCDRGSMCWELDPLTEVGRCIPQCGGSANAPVCNDTGTACATIATDLLNLCLQRCDPLLQDCAGGSGCYLLGGQYSCQKDRSYAMGQFGDSCQFINACAPGLRCVAADRVPACETSFCCTPFCDVTVANGICNGTAPGLFCAPVFAPGTAPDPRDEDVGSCAPAL